jgi:hypothetical protein
MDRLTHKSITNCIKELDALEKLVLSGEYDTQKIADCISEVSWNLAGIFRRQRYDSDEFQHALRKILKERKRASLADKREQGDD